MNVRDILNKLEVLQRLSDPEEKEAAVVCYLQAVIQQSQKWPRKLRRLFTACLEGNRDIRKLSAYLKAGDMCGWQTKLKLENWSFKK